MKWQCLFQCGEKCCWEEQLLIWLPLSQARYPMLCLSLSATWEECMTDNKLETACLLRGECMISKSHRVHTNSGECCSQSAPFSTSSSCANCRISRARVCAVQDFDAAHKTLRPILSYPSASSQCEKSKIVVEIGTIFLALRASNCITWTTLVV